MKQNIKILYQYIKNFRFNSIFYRNLILITLAVILPLLTMCSAFYINIQKSAQSEISVITQSKATIIKNITDTILHTTDTLAIQTALNNDICNICLPVYEYDNNINNTYDRIRAYISGYTNIYPYINSIYVYSEKFNIVFENQEIISFDDHSDKGWYSLYQNASPLKTIISPRKKNGGYPSFISFIRPISIDGKNKLGCIVINLETEYLNSIYSGVKEITSGSAIVWNDNEQILLCPNIKFVGNTLSDYMEIENPTEKIKTDFGDLNFQDQSYIYATNRSDYYDISYLLLMPKTDFNTIMSRTTNFFVTLCCIVFLLCLLITIIISVKVYTPFQKIMDIIIPTETPNNYDINNKNELVYITDTIKKSLDKTDFLIEELNYRMLLLRESQTYALQSQINPHFINNTLESINWTAISSLGEDNKISKIIKPLSKLLSISLNMENYLIPIEEELIHANTYMYIVSLNYGSDVSFVWDIKDDISQYKIIKLSLQPILENAVIHGINPKRGKGKIKISGCLLQDNILITISDDGVGMTSEELTRLQNELKGDTIKGKNIGIKNVNQRIKLIFGENYGITINSEKNKGTTVSLLFPKTDI